MRLVLLSSAIIAGGLVCFGPQQALGQRALAVVVSEAADAWTIVCMRDLVTDAVSCSMIAPIEVFAGQGWQGLDPAVLTVTNENRDGQQRPVISVVSPDFSFAAAFRFDARRAFRIEGNCEGADCRVADAFTQPLADEFARSATAVIRGASGPDLRVQMSGYAGAWARLQVIAAERVRPGDEAAALVPPDPVTPGPGAPSLPEAPLTTVRLQTTPGCDR